MGDGEAAASPRTPISTPQLESLELLAFRLAVASALSVNQTQVAILGVQEGLGAVVAFQLSYRYPGNGSP